MKLNLDFFCFQTRVISLDKRKCFMKLLDIYTFLKLVIINCYLHNIWHLVGNVVNYVTWYLKEKGRKKDEKDCLSIAASLESETELSWKLYNCWTYICIIFLMMIFTYFACILCSTGVLGVLLDVWKIWRRCIRSIIGRSENMKKVLVRVIHSMVFIKLLIRCILSMYFYLIISLSIEVNYFWMLKAPSYI